MLTRLRHARLRWTTWWVVCAALLLQAAAPYLAHAAAQVRGVALVEVCDAYGVRLVALDREHAPGEPAEHDDSGVHSAPCVLTLLGAPPLPPTPEPRRAFLALATPAPIAPPKVHRGLDAAATWQAAHKQGPPSAA